MHTLSSRDEFSSYRRLASPASRSGINPLRRGMIQLGLVIMAVGLMQMLAGVSLDDTASSNAIGLDPFDICAVCMIRWYGALLFAFGVLLLLSSRAARQSLAFLAIAAVLILFDGLAQSIALQWSGQISLLQTILLVGEASCPVALVCWLACRMAPPSQEAAMPRPETLIPPGVIIPAPADPATHDQAAQWARPPQDAVSWTSTRPAAPQSRPEPAPAPFHPPVPALSLRPLAAAAPRRRPRLDGRTRKTRTRHKEG